MAGTNLQDWVGKEEVVEDALSVERAQQMAATLNIDPKRFTAGSSLPLGWQWLYFNPVVATGDLDVDGHPKRGGFLPPVSLLRRMWAAGEMKVSAPLAVGRAATRHSTIRNVAEKEGRSGPLIFVTVDHVYLQDGEAKLQERQEIVYREATAGPMPERRPLSPRDADWQVETSTNEVLLFRYSALTFNAHRIHHDLAYAWEVEGYPGLVVHGPLMATLLAGFAADNLARPLKAFSFRAKQPLFAGEALLLKGARKEGGGAFWIEGAGAYEIMEAEAMT